MQRLLWFFFLLGMTVPAWTQSEASPDSNLLIEIPEGPKPWSSLHLNNGEDQFQFAIVTDRTGGHRPGVFLDGVRKLNLLQPEFVMSVGDLIEGYTEDTVELNRQWEEFDGFIGELKMPFFYVPGNHDITNQVMEDLWKSRFGVTHYYFIYKDVLFLCLNSEDQRRGSGRGSISDEQYEWIKSVLEEHTEVRWTLLFMHQPLWLQESDPARWADVEELLRDRQHTVFVGHRHHYVKYERNNGKYFMLGTTGGSSSLRGPQLGEFDHVVWVTMTDAGPIVANLALNGIWDEDVVDEMTADFITRVGEKPFLRIEPFYVTTDTFREGSIRLRFTNDEDTPMIARLKTGFSWDLLPELETDSLLVPPNSVLFTDLKLRPRKVKPIQEMDAVDLKIDLSFPAGGRPDVAIPFSYALRPEPYRLLETTEKKITIDANLSEWPALPYQVAAKDTSDLNGRFQLLYDDEYLYVAGEIRDNDLQVDTSVVTWQQDYAGFVISADPLGQAAMRTGRGWYENSLILILSPETPYTPEQPYYEERLPEGAQYRCRSSGNSYFFEAAVPLSYLTERQGQDWRTLRANFTVQDWDEGEDEKPRYYFEPDWRSKSNRVGSGMFFRGESER